MWVFEEERQCGHGSLRPASEAPERKRSGERSAQPLAPKCIDERRDRISSAEDRQRDRDLGAHLMVVGRS